MKNCQEITKDIEQDLFQRLPFKNRMEIKLHLAICPECKAYFKDSRAIDKLLIERFKTKLHYHFSESEKQKMKKRLSN